MTTEPEQQQPNDPANRPSAGTPAETAGPLRNRIGKMATTPATTKPAAQPQRPSAERSQGAAGSATQESEGAEHHETAHLSEPPSPTLADFAGGRPQEGDHAGRIRMPSKHSGTPDELQRELESVLGDASLDQLLQNAESKLKIPEIEIDARRQAQVVRVHRDNVFFSLDGRNEGVAPLRQFKDPPNPGDAFEVVVTGYLPEDGLYELSMPGASIEVGDWSDITEGALVEARVTAANTGGLECMVNQLRAFIPASQVALYRVEDFSEYIDQKLVCVVTEADPDRRNLVLSRRAVLEREKEEARKTLLEQIQEGDAREGIVRNIRDFGAFVDLGGVDGLLHVSQLSWDRVNHPSEVLTEGQRVKVRVEKIDRQTGKISLSYRSLQEHPWEKVPQQFPVGSIVKGTVSRLAKFGAFVKLAPGVEGLVHISEISNQRVHNVASLLREGQEVETKVVSLDAENQRIGLSIKAVANIAAQQAAAEEEEQASPAATAPKKDRGPLKGGVDRSSGGESFGLKW